MTESGLLGRERERRGLPKLIEAKATEQAKLQSSIDEATNSIRQMARDRREQQDRLEALVRQSRRAGR